MNIAVILSGGVGSRMRADGFPKQYIPVKEKPVLMYTLEKYQASPAIDKIVIVADPVWHGDIRAWMENAGITKFADFALPGTSRQGSVYNGLKACAALAASEETANVAIHDGVRPLVSLELIAACMDALGEYDGCMPVLAVTDTTYLSQDGMHIAGLLDRSTLFSGLTPEAFRLWPFLRIHENASEEELENTRGSTEIAYKHGMNMRLIPGEYSNFKLTTPTDLDRFRAILEDTQ